jgi:hypothetical protein
MNQKNENPIDSKVATETKTTQGKPEKTPATAASESVQTPKSSSAGQGGPGELSPEVVELVTELRDTVKRLDPRKHTLKTLRRALSNVSDILTDIDKLYTQD